MSDDSSDLTTRLDETLSRLRRDADRRPEMPGLTDALHEMSPSLTRAAWASLGDEVRRRERETSALVSVDGSQWISLRLDGSGFSKYLRVLRKAGVMEAGFSATFAAAMQRCVQSLMEYVHGCVGYTQSDEMTVLIPPARVVRGEQQCHLRGGRVLKLCTLAAAHVTALFNHEVSGLAAAAGVSAEERGRLLAAFDCRMGAYPTLHEASALLLWRAYDSALNGVGDAVFQRGAKRVMTLPTPQKVAWLLEQGHLPLPPHQAYGSFFRKVLAPHVGHNPVTGESVETTRSKVVMVPVGNLVNFLAKEDLVYVDHRGEARDAAAAADGSGDDGAEGNDAGCDVLGCVDTEG
eukprot:Rhum_TRINITY_DN20730_c0_g1::Rhum_TRINITY_DN20730_c0_g1_i1::g.171982::m.171982